MQSDIVSIITVHTVEPVPSDNWDSRHHVTSDKNYGPKLFL